jgi:CBS domain-containing protein
MATIADILAKKGSRVYCVSPTATVLEATQMMARHRIGALVVSMKDENGGGEGGAAPSAGECDRVVGMFTERDVLTRIVGEKRDPAKTLVEEVMTSNVAYVRPETKLEEVGAVMTERRIRHLPVCDEGGGLKGLVSIGDLNAWYSAGLEVEIHYLHEYIYGRV